MAFPPIDDIFGDFGKIGSKELAVQMKTTIDLISAMVPIGDIVPIMVNIPGVEAPDPNIWQECDGSEITNPNSPLRSVPSQLRFVPDLRDRYLRITKSLGQVGFTGGVNTYSGFGHSHGIGSWTSPENADSSKNADQNTQFDHSHSLGGDLYGTYPMEPLNFVVKFFMKIQ